MRPDWNSWWKRSLVSIRTLSHSPLRTDQADFYSPTLIDLLILQKDVICLHRNKRISAECSRRHSMLVGKVRPAQWGILFLFMIKSHSNLERFACSILLIVFPTKHDILQCYFFSFYTQMKTVVDNYKCTYFNGFIQIYFPFTAINGQALLEWILIFRTSTNTAQH